MTKTERKLLARHAAMHKAGEKLEDATLSRDVAIYEATRGEQPAMTVAGVARLLGIRRETAYNAIRRVESTRT